MRNSIVEGVHIAGPSGEWQAVRTWAGGKCRLSAAINSATGATAVVVVTFTPDNGGTPYNLGNLSNGDTDLELPPGYFSFAAATTGSDDLSLSAILLYSLNPLGVGQV